MTNGAKNTSGTVLSDGEDEEDGSENIEADDDTMTVKDVTKVPGAISRAQTAGGQCKNREAIGCPSPLLPILLQGYFIKNKPKQDQILVDNLKTLEQIPLPLIAMTTTLIGHALQESLGPNIVPIQTYDYNDLNEYAIAEQDECKNPLSTTDPKPEVAQDDASNTNTVNGSTVSAPDLDLEDNEDEQGVPGNESDINV
ncbi:hypothetical protein GYMLUDRAFT_246139 [Collybiopsis luxurians FD-317 M1]|uniref:Uncharacterized protein n=1 Tax=Collybiopsis luxurians FD-317 M1 TaxID=944289 RepID=A0A0D0BSW1_9AGAR|nr:hypothetical protein GYMLUDRAFT_246139 [Collybiopsis luxurians FD-317 M1]